MDGEPSEGLGKLLGRLGGEPPDQPVGTGVGVGVVQGKAGLPNTAEAVQRGGLGDQSAAVRVGQGVGDGARLALPADEPTGGAKRQVGRQMAFLL
ncbi:hypothetical protein [Kitasatospora herbaricolor]|uniref:hypothetical protein n=1 Tax=Kitasatospora herbaricolor TaxID=68217 RepID=UPI0036D9E993